VFIPLRYRALPCPRGQTLILLQFAHKGLALAQATVGLRSKTPKTRPAPERPLGTTRVPSPPSGGNFFIMWRIPVGMGLLSPD
jgi:hypothetical protein